MRGRLLSVVLGAGIAAGLLTAGTAGAAELVNCEVSPDDQAVSAEELQFLDLLNQYRASAGAPALQPSATLSRASAWMALDMYGHGYVSHTDSHGRNAGARVLDCGYHTGAAEIIAVGMLDAQGALDGFKGSSGHNQIMRDPRYLSAGVGHFRAPDGLTYWVVDLGLELELAEEPEEPPVPLFEGWTLINGWEGPGLEGAGAIQSFLIDKVDPDSWVTLAEYDPAANQWRQTLKDAPIGSFNTMLEVRPGATYWIYVESDATLDGAP